MGFTSHGAAGYVKNLIFVKETGEIAVCMLMKNLI